MHRFPPGPKGSFFGLSLARQFQRNPLELIRRIGFEYGDMAGFRMGPVRACLINHPDLIREVLVTKARQFRKVERIKGPLRSIDGNGLIISEGDFWARQRRLVQFAFHPRHMPRYADITVEYAHRMLDRWQNECRLDINSQMTQLTCAIIARLLFNVELTGKAAELGKAIHALSEIAVGEMGAFVNLPDWLPLPEKRRKRWAIGALDAVIRDVIRERRASGEDKGDLLSKLLLAVDEESDGTGMTDEQARDEAITLFNAGHDTTAAGLAWTWYAIAKHPEVQSRLRDEVESVVGNRRARFDDLARLTYTEMVVKESLRFYPPTWALFTRETVEEVEMNGYLLPRGTWVYIFPWVTQHDPRFFENPESFDPERFAPERVEQIPQHAYVPFGAGPHVCIGKGLATMEMILIVASVISRYHVELPPGEVVEPEPFLSLRPKGGLQMNVVRTETAAV
jgi:cytochrome P450